MSQHIGSRTISAIGGSVKRVGNYRVHTFPSELVTDGLVLNLDAGDPRSYPSSGTTWTDLSGNGNNGTLVNGPTYSNADGGFIDFVSTSAVRVPISSTLQSGYYTIDLWVKFDSFSTSPIIFSNHYQANGTVSGVVISTSTSGVLTYQTRHNNVCCQTYTNNTLSANTWYNLTLSYDGSKIVVYTNGVAVNTISATGTHQNINDFYLANNSDQIAGGDYTSNNLDGKISIFRYYNRALSAAEVAQNYDALRVRYGTYTNTFTPICAGGEGKVEALCVAGGGSAGGAYYHGGGGGAGGLIYNSSFSVDSSTGVSVTVGRGGYTPFNDSTTPTKGENGVNTTFGTLTSVGGGGGGGYSGAGEGGKNGGSGGGAGNTSGSAGVGGSGTSLQGNDGGDTSSTTGGSKIGGGGGGAGGPGEFGGIATGGNGGSGLAYSISGTSQYYAGGGGGSTEVSTQFTKGGSGIGGDGNWNAGTNGIPNTGSGGGAGERISPAISGNGSNGIVIVRYPATDYNVEVLVVGGGGGGGKCGLSGSDPGGGGGGAGGLIYNSSYPVSSGKKLQISVGKGGRGTSVRDNPTTENGSNSIFNDLVAIGGGKGGTVNSSGSNGGSGGGGGGNTGSTSLGIPGQGNDGYGSDSNYGGGGGGAGSSGTLPTGGDGLAYSITGTSTYYAGGGAGGSRLGYATGIGGIGGGGNGGAGSNNATNGTVNTGGGGGGSSVGVSGDGGSGIVIIAYKGPQRGIGGTIDTTSRPGYTLHKFTTTETDFFIP